GGRWRADRKTRKRAFWTGMGSPPSSKTRTRRRRTASWTKKKSSSSSASKSKTVSHGIGLLMEAAQGDPERHHGLPPLVRRAEEEGEGPSRGFLVHVGLLHPLDAPP